MKISINLLPFFAFAFICAILLAGIIASSPEVGKSPLIGKIIPDVVITDKEGREKNLHSLAEGKAFIINIFASWCVPCAVEHKELMKLSANSSLPLIGIAWKNKPEDVEKWLALRGNPYSDLFFDQEGKLTVKLAMTGVPETLIVNERKIVIYHSREILTEEKIKEIDSEIMPILRKMENSQK